MIELLSRDEELKKIYRYVWSPCEPMFYRPNLYIHSNRVEWLAFEIAKTLISISPKIREKIDLDFIRELAKFHDDAELITWDFISLDKESFSDEKRKEYEENCQNAISILYENYWNIYSKFNYKELLEIHETKEWLAFKIVDFADKLDAHLEVCHELFAWNRGFFIKLEKWGLNVDVFDYTKNKLKKILPQILAELSLENEKLDFKNTLNLKQSQLKSQGN